MKFPIKDFFSKCDQMWQNFSDVVSIIEDWFVIIDLIYTRKTKQFTRFKNENSL